MPELLDLNAARGAVPASGEGHGVAAIRNCQETGFHDRTNHLGRVVANNRRRPRLARQLRPEPVRRGRRGEQKDLGVHNPGHQTAAGLLHFYAGVSPKGSIVQVSVWDTDGHAAQLDRLKEMVVDGRRDMEAVGVTFTPIFNYPMDWTWTV